MTLARNRDKMRTKSSRNFKQLNTLTRPVFLHSQRPQLSAIVSATVSAIVSEKMSADSRRSKTALWPMKPPTIRFQISPTDRITICRTADGEYLNPCDRAVRHGTLWATSADTFEPHRRTPLMNRGFFADVATKTLRAVGNSKIKFW